MKFIHFLIFSIFLLISCNKSEKSQEAILIKTGYYPPFVQHFEIIVNIENKSLIFYNPSKYLIAPPPPFEKNSTKEEKTKLQAEHEKYIADNPKIEPEFLDLNNEEINEIQNNKFIFRKRLQRR